jgi:hypothetical protein
MIRERMKNVNVQVSPLILQSVPGKRYYKLVQDFVVDIGTEQFTVPKGFVTDLISSPRAFWSFIPPGNYGKEAAVLHDYLLESGKDRVYCDKVFRQVLEGMGIKKKVTFFLYHSVRLYSLFLRKVSNGRG